MESLGIAVFDFRCTAHVEREGPEELNPTHSIVFVRRGLFRRTYRGTTLTADPNHILFFNSGESYRYSHPLPGGDDCTILAVATPVALDLVARHAAGDAGRPEKPFRLGQGLSSRRASWLHYELLALVQAGAQPLALEDTLSELADEAVRTVYKTPPAIGKVRASSAAALRHRRELVEDAKVVVNHRMDSLPSLGELAQKFQCSPFHLSRTFRKIAGLSLRRYIARLRTAIAAERLANGARDLTNLALDLGFADHSHFTNTFCQAWGVPPSQFRAHFGPVDCARISKQQHCTLR